MLSIEQQWPADEVKRQPVASLVPSARNARTHSADQVGQLVASICEWGWTIPVLVDEAGGIIAGHGRILAAAQLGLEDVPVMTARGWSDEKKRAYMLADNKLALNSGWDAQLLGAELTDLQATGFGTDLMGFSAVDLAALLEPAQPDAGPPAADAAPKPSRAGNLAATFGAPPFSVLNAREGWWQDRKRAWTAIGIQSELGRGVALTVGVTASGDGARAHGGGGLSGKATAAAFDGQASLNALKGSGHKANATPGGSKMPAADYGKSGARGDGRGRAVA